MSVPNHSNAYKEQSAMIFIENKYTCWYYNIINSAKTRNIRNKKEAKTVIGYSEKHHIIPKSLNGLNVKENLIFLTAREHLICHLLLTKMVEGQDKIKMQYALGRMLHIENAKFGNFQIKSRTYNYIRTQIAEAASNTHRGRKDSEETRLKKSKALKGRPSPTKGMTAWNRGISMTQEAKEKASKKLSNRISWNKGVQASKESNEKRREKMSGIPKEKILCPHCNKIGGKPVMIKNHFDKCKFKIDVLLLR
jgi:hypothetical protein